MKVLVISHFFPPEMGAAAARLSGLSRWLADFGHEVTVITGFPNYPTGTIPAEYRKKLYVEEKIGELSVVRTWVYASPKRSSLRRMGNYLSFMVSATIAGLVQKKSYDVVLVSSPPLFLGIAGWLVSLFKGTPWVFDIRDIWPDVAIEAGEFKEDSMITGLLYKLANFLYNRANIITPVTQNKLTKLMGCGVPASKMHIVSNGVDLDLIPQEVTDLREELGLQEKFVVLYAGLIGLAQGVEKTLIPAADQLRERKNVHFLIVGEGPCKEALSAEITSRGLQNVTVLPRQAKEDMPAILTTANCCFVPLVSSNLQDAVPSKLLEAWAYRRPVLLVAAGEAAAIVEECNGGLVVSPEEPNELGHAILKIVEDPSCGAQYAASGYEYVSSRLDRRMLAKQMEVALIKAVDSASKKGKVIHVDSTDSQGNRTDPVLAESTLSHQ